MAFSQLTIADVQVTRAGVELYVVWSAPASARHFQVYIDRRLAWCGMQHFCTVPVPAAAEGRNIWVEVGTVDLGELSRDHSHNLTGPSGTGSRVMLNWFGGTYLDAQGANDIQGYRIYKSTLSGGAVDFSKSIASIPAYPSGTVTDGFGMGAFGGGGFGRSASFYEWHSESLPSGTWAFAVAPHDKSGNSQGFPALTSAEILCAPLPPGINDHGGRLTFSYTGATTRVATLRWLASSSH